jgi:hypothetical protein
LTCAVLFSASVLARRENLVFSLAACRKDLRRRSARGPRNFLGLRTHVFRFGTPRAKEDQQLRRLMAVAWRLQRLSFESFPR